jgi:acyl carrier protein
MVDEVKKIISELLKIKPEEVEQLVKEKEFTYFDSLKFLNFIIALEEHFNVSLEPEDIETMNNFAQCIEILQTKQKQI